MSAADSSTSDSGDSSHEPVGRIVSPAQVRRMLRARRDWPNRQRKLDRMREEYARCKSYRPRRPSAIRHAEAIVHKRNDLPKIRASARFVRFPLGEPRLRLPSLNRGSQGQIPMRKGNRALAFELRCRYQPRIGPCG